MRILLILAATSLSVSACSGPAEQPPPDDRPVPDACAMLDPVLAQLGKFHRTRGIKADRRHFCFRQEDCETGDDDCGSPEYDVRREVKLLLAGVGIDANPYARDRSKARKIDINGRRSTLWTPSSNQESGARDCAVSMSLSKLRSVRVTAFAKGSAEQTCALARTVAEEVEPKLPPELRGV